jgi:hypothetical protein
MASIIRDGKVSISNTPIDDYIRLAVSSAEYRADSSYSEADIEYAYCNVMRELNKVCGCKMSRLERMILEQYKNFMDELIPDYEEIADS